MARGGKNATKGFEQELTEKTEANFVPIINGCEWTLTRRT